MHLSRQMFCFALYLISSSHIIYWAQLFQTILLVIQWTIFHLPSCSTIAHQTTLVTGLGPTKSRLEITFFYEVLHIWQDHWISSSRDWHDWCDNDFLSRVGPVSVQPPSDYWVAVKTLASSHWQPATNTNQQSIQSVAEHAQHTFPENFARQSHIPPPHWPTIVTFTPLV